MDDSEGEVESGLEDAMASDSKGSTVDDENPKASEDIQPTQDGAEGVWEDVAVQDKDIAKAKSSDKSQKPSLPPMPHLGGGPLSPESRA